MLATVKDLIGAYESFVRGYAPEEFPSWLAHNMSPMQYAGYVLACGGEMDAPESYQSGLFREAAKLIAEARLQPVRGNGEYAPSVIDELDSARTLLENCAVKGGYQVRLTNDNVESILLAIIHATEELEGEGAAEPEQVDVMDAIREHAAQQDGVPLADTMGAIGEAMGFPASVKRNRQREREGTPNPLLTEPLNETLSPVTPEQRNRHLANCFVSNGGLLRRYQESLDSLAGDSRLSGKDAFGFDLRGTLLELKGRVTHAQQGIESVRQFCIGWLKAQEEEPEVSRIAGLNSPAL